MIVEANFQKFGKFDNDVQFVLYNVQPLDPPPPNGQCLLVLPGIVIELWPTPYVFRNRSFSFLFFWGVGGVSWKSVGKFTKFHALLVCSVEGKVDSKFEISSIMNNHVTSLGISHPDKDACKVSNTSTPDFSTNLWFDIILLCWNNGHNKIYDIPMFRHFEISVHICRNISTHLSKYRCFEIAVRRNNGTAPRLVETVLLYFPNPGP